MVFLVLNIFNHSAPSDGFIITADLYGPFKLAVTQFCVKAVTGQQLLMIALLHNAALIHD